MITRLKGDFLVYLIEVTATLETCIKRVKQRGVSVNFPKDDKFVIESERRYLDAAQFKYQFDLKIENNNISEQKILSAFSNIFG